MVGEPALRDRWRRSTRRTLPELQPKLAGNQLGILEQHLVERANPEQNDDARMVVTQLQVLVDEVAVRCTPLHGGQSGQSSGIGSYAVPSSTNCACTASSGWS